MPTVKTVSMNTFKCCAGSVRCDLRGMHLVMFSPICSGTELTVAHFRISWTTSNEELS